MKYVKNTMAMAVLGLACMNAIAGESVHWGDGDSGASQDEVWTVVKPAQIDFTITPTDITSIADDGYVNGLKATGGAGVWKNKSGAVKLIADSYDQRYYRIAAKGDVSSEALYFDFIGSDGKTITTKYDPKGIQIPENSNGKLNAYISTDGGTTSVKNITDVKSNTFTSRITIDHWQA